MSGLNQSFEHVFVASTPVLLAQGTTADLVEGQVGIFDGESYEATVNPTYAKNKGLIIAQGRTDLSHLGEYLLNGYDSASDKSKLIKGKLITGWSGKKASRGKTEIITIGYDGADITKNLTGVDGINKHLYIKLSGDPITKLYSEQGIIRHYIYDGATCEDCGDVVTDPEKLADFYIERINKDNYINRYARASKLVYNPTPSTPTTVSYTKWTVSVTDDGDLGAISAIKAQYPTAGVKFVSRTGFVSTYELTRLTSLGTPAAVSVTLPILVPDCPTCPSGYTLAAEQTVYVVTRPVAPTTDLSTPAAQQTYANTIGTAYGATGRGVASLGGVNGSGYTNGTYNITATGGGTGFAGTITVTGGAITSRVITNKGIGYTSAPTIALPAGIGAGTGGTITATIEAAPTVTSKFVSLENGSAKVLISLPTTVGDLTALLSDELSQSQTTGAVCTPPAGTTVAWTNAGTLLAYQKAIKITVGDDCGDDVLPQIQAAFPDLVITQRAGTPEGNCVHVYDSNIFSDPVGDDCSIDQLVYHLPDAYKGIDWVAVEPAEGEVPVGKVAGIKIEAAFVDWKSNECTYDYFPKEYGPVYLEASHYNPDYNASPCDETSWPVTKIQTAEFPHGDGYMVRKQEDRQSSLRLRERSINPGVRQAEGYSPNSELDKYYDEYTLSFEFKYKVLGWSETYVDSYRLTYFVEEGQGKQYETAINQYIVGASIGLDPVVL